MKYVSEWIYKDRAFSLWFLVGIIKPDQGRGAIYQFHLFLSFCSIAITRGDITLKPRHFTVQLTVPHPLQEKLDHVLITEYMVGLHPEALKYTYSLFKVHFLFGKMNLKITNSMKALVPVQPENTVCVSSGEYAITPQISMYYKS